MSAFPARALFNYQFSIFLLTVSKICVYLQRFKQPPELNSGFSPKAQDIERQCLSFLL